MNITTIIACVILAVIFALVLGRIVHNKKAGKMLCGAEKPEALNVTRETSNE